MSALFPEDVADYLKNNPGFFEQYADLMAQIFVPHPHGGRAVSLAERQMLTLREKNRQTESKLAELIAFGEENDQISEKVHRLAVGLVASLADEGQKPGVLVASRQTTTAKVTAIDTKAHTATLLFEDGLSRVVPVREDVTLSADQVGKQVVIVETVAVAAEAIKL